MLFTKQGHVGQVGDVQFVNGKVAFRGVRLNVYSFCYDGVLIDTGASSMKDIFYPFFHTQSFDQVMLTHIHEDHTGNAAYIERTLQVPIYLNEKAFDLAHKEGDYLLYRKMFWGRREPFSPLAMPKTFSSRTYDWEVIETPGHAFDHCAFLNRSTGQLFTGDLYVQTKLKLTLREEDTPTTIASLEKLLAYDFGEVFCNHAGYIENGREQLQAKYDYLKTLQYRVGRLHAEGYDSEHINRVLFPRKYPITKLSFGEWDSRHIVRSLLADLQVQASNM